MSRLTFALLLLSIAGCDQPPLNGANVDVPASDTLTFEGEYRGTDGHGRWMRCTDGHYFTVQGPGADSLFRAYAAQVGHVGDAAKVWLAGSWSADSVVLVRKTLMLAPAMRCEPVANEAGSGSYFIALPGGEANKRTVRVDLFANGRATQYSTIGGGPEREESGTWGMDSDGLLKLTWPQRPMTFTFALHGDSLRQMAPLPPGAEIVLLRSGPPDAGRGVFGEVCRIVLAEPGAVAPSGGTKDILPSTPLRSLLPGDTDLKALASTIAERYGMSTEMHDRRWPTMETVQDLTELVRSLKR
ncbi:MAG: hypothetical protein ABI599_05735 [Flavobacteriales bacterium]